MLEGIDLIPKDFNWEEYCYKNNLYELVKLESSPKKEESYHKKDIYNTVNPNNMIPYPAEFDDLARLHYISAKRKVTTILEFGVGKSSLIFF